jgi:hypothetical protein
MIVLPISNRPPVSQSPAVLLLYGPAKVGKTSSVVQLEDNLIFDLETGARLLSGLIVDVPQITRDENIGSLDLLREYYKQLKHNGNYRYITFDTIDVLEDLFINEVSLKNSVDHISDLAYGKGDALLREAFFQLVDAFKNLGCKIILIAHRHRSIIGETSAEVIIRELDLRGKMRNMIMGYADAIGYMYSTNGSLLVSFKTAENEDIAAGSRCPYLANREIKLGEFSEKGELVRTYWERIYPELDQTNNQNRKETKNDHYATQRTSSRSGVQTREN